MKYSKETVKVHPGLQKYGTIFSQVQTCTKNSKYLCPKLANFKFLYFTEHQKQEVLLAETIFC